MLTAAPNKLAVRLPLPHTKQREIVANTARRVVICSGRRSGKTTLAAIVACEKLRDGRRVLLASTTQEQADAFWDKCKAWLHALIEAGIVVKNEQRRILTLGATGRIKVKTASDADTLRGDYADFLVLDECALLAPDAWEKVGAPMLLDNDGDAWFISTPRRRNWFFHLYQKAMADDTGRWKAWHFTSYDNPYLSAAALDELQSDMTQEDIDQEILAKFLEGQGQVFRNIDACLHAPVGSTPEQHFSLNQKGERVPHEFVMGVDWGQSKDATSLSVLCVTCRCEVAIDRFNQLSWDIQRGRLKVLYERWRPYTILAESNSIGGPNIEALLADDLPVTGFVTTASSKPPLIKALALSLERADVQWLPDPVARGELEAYEVKINANTGHATYGSPESLHDDTVISRAIALRAASTWGSLL